MNDSSAAGVDLTRRRTLLAMAAMAPALALGMANTDAHADTIAGQADLDEAVNAYRAATLANDVVAMAELVADDFLLVNSDSSMQNRESYLADFEVPGFRIRRYELEEPLRREWSGNALTGGLLNLEWRQDGAEQRRRLRLVHVWTVRDGRWQILYTQLTRVPEQGDPA